VKNNFNLLGVLFGLYVLIKKHFFYKNSFIEYFDYCLYMKKLSIFSSD